MDPDLRKSCRIYNYYGRCHHCRRRLHRHYFCNSFYELKVSILTSDVSFCLAPEMWIPFCLRLRIFVPRSLGLNLISNWFSGRSRISQRSVVPAGDVSVASMSSGLTPKHTRGHKTANSRSNNRGQVSNNNWGDEQLGICRKTLTQCPNTQIMTQTA